ncbi:MAG: NADH-quinone oxidoreductase subunit A [Nitriliruptorales bacterium]
MAGVPTAISEPRADIHPRTVALARAGASDTEERVTDFYAQWTTFAILAAVAIGVYAAVITINRFMGPSLPSPAKLTTYECGVDPAGSGWSQVNIRYYVFAFLFVIFDVEALFLFPWAVILGTLESGGGEALVSATFALVEMFVFIGILALGLLYAWRKGVLQWD